VAAAFMKANPGLSRTALAVACDASRLTEVRLCMTKDLAKDFSFHDCADVVSHACKRDKIAMPAVHGDMSGMK
jgi:ribonuclease T2